MQTMGSCCIFSKRDDNYNKIKSNKMPYLKHAKCLSTDDIFSKYTMLKTIGQGSFSKVIEVSKIADPSIRRIVKVVSKESVKDSEKMFMNELTIMMELDHPNIVAFYEAYEDSDKYYIVMEKIAGPSLLDRVANLSDYDENFVRKVLYQIISAINYLHSVGVCHRDLKPANIILVSEDQDCYDIKIIDFGLSCKNEVEMDECLGTPYYIAPEVLNKKYSFECDVWSIGIIAAFLFTGKPYFRAETKDELIHKIKFGPVNLVGEDWDDVTDTAKELIKKMLERKIDKRISPKQALRDPFFTKTNLTVHNTRKLDKSILKNMKRFSHHEAFKKLVIGCLVKTLSPEHLKRLDNAFNAMDLDHEGFIDLEELGKAFTKAEIDVTEDEISEMLKTLDSDGNGRLNYSEFLVAAINIKTYITEKNLRQFFLSVDVSRDGYIDGKKMKAMMNRAGRRINTKEIDKIITEVGTSDKKIAFEDFVSLFNDN